MSPGEDTMMTYDLTKYFTGGGGPDMWDIDFPMTVSEVTAALSGAMLTLTLNDGMSYSNIEVMGSVTAGDITLDQTFTVRRNKKPVAGTKPLGMVTVGTQVGHDMATVTIDHGMSSNERAYHFLDSKDDTLTYSGAADSVANQKLASLITGVKPMVMGIKTTKRYPETTGDGVTEAQLNRRKAVTVLITATDADGLESDGTISLMVAVDEAPRLSDTTKLRDLPINLATERGLQYQALEGHFEDPDAPPVATAEHDPLKYTVKSSNPNSVKADIVCGTVDANTGVFTVGNNEYMAVGGCTTTGDVAGIEINPIRAGTATITVTAIEQGDFVVAGEVVEKSREQSTVDTFTVTVKV